MHIVVVGGTGMVGSRIVQEARARGHEVTSVTRSGAPQEGIETVRGDIADTALVTRLAGDADAVVFAVPPDRSGGPTAPIVDAHRAIIAAAPAARVLVVGGAGGLEAEPGVLLKDTADFPASVKPESDAFVDILQLYRDSGLDWTMVHPAPVIEPGQRTGAYTSGTEALVGPHVSAEDFAVAVVDELERAQHRRGRLAVADA